MPSEAPYGTWVSPISVDAVTASAVRIAAVTVDASSGSIYHIESRPSEKGRSVIVKRSLDDVSKETDVFGEGWNARSGVHEYGGGAMAVKDGVVWFSDYGSSRIYSVKEGTVEAFTFDNPAHRFADFNPHPKISFLLASVMEDHTHPLPADVINSLVLLRPGEAPVTIASGADFYAFPRWSPDGKWLAWTEWNHPNMPWDGSELKIAEVKMEGGNTVLGQSKSIAGKQGEVSITEVVWASPTRLLFLCDVSGYYNPWMYDTTSESGQPLLPSPIEEEFASPPWNFGNFSIAVLTPNLFLFAVCSQGVDQLYMLTLAPELVLEPIRAPFVSYDHLCAASPTQAVFVGATDTTSSALVLFTLYGDACSGEATYAFRTVKSTTPAGFSSDLFSPVERHTLKTPDGSVYVNSYQPKNPDYIPATEEKPPVIISAHGGPTGRAEPGMDLLKQFFTTPGWAWVDVNYGGSTGYGRAYRDRLNGQWGVVDVRDCSAAVKAMGDAGLVDSKRAVIRGRSSGGFTVLLAMCLTPDIWAAGTSLYGISDLAALAGDTHKFESQYGYKLLGGTPEEVPDVYKDRSALTHADKITAPLLILQGSVDAVVPPSQAEYIVEKIKQRGGKVEYVVFEGEGHGWRRADTMKIALSKELAWYEEVLGLSKTAS